MRVSNILLLALFLVMGSMVFMFQNMQDANGSLNSPAPARALPVPVPTIKPVPIALSKASLPQFHLDLSAPKDVGSHGRLSLDAFLAPAEPEVIIRPAKPKAAAEHRSNAAPVRPAPHFMPLAESKLDLSLQPLPIETANPVSLPNLSINKDTLFIDRMVEIAEASPVQPDSRGCGTLNHGLGVKKQSKVRSVAMQRQLTGRTSIGVEYVYKDGCYKTAISTLPVQNMPGDDGVNLRVNMKF